MVVFAEGGVSAFAEFLDLAAAFWVDWDGRWRVPIFMDAYQGAVEGV